MVEKAIIQSTADVYVRHVTDILQQDVLDAESYMAMLQDRHRHAAALAERKAAEANDAKFAATGLVRAAAASQRHPSQQGVARIADQAKAAVYSADRRTKEAIDARLQANHLAQEVDAAGHFACIQKLRLDYMSRASQLPKEDLYTWSHETVVSSDPYCAAVANRSLHQTRELMELSHRCMRGHV